MLTIILQLIILLFFILGLVYLLLCVASHRFFWFNRHDLCMLKEFFYASCYDPEYSLGAGVFFFTGTVTLYSLDPGLANVYGLRYLNYIDYTLTPAHANIMLHFFDSWITILQSENVIMESTAKDCYWLSSKCRWVFCDAPVRLVVGIKPGLTPVFGISFNIKF